MFDFELMACMCAFLEKDVLGSCIDASVVQCDNVKAKLHF